MKQKKKKAALVFSLLWPLLYVQISEIHLRLHVQTLENIFVIIPFTNQGDYL